MDMDTKQWLQELQQMQASSRSNPAMLHQYTDKAFLINMHTNLVVQNGKLRADPFFMKRSVTTGIISNTTCVELDQTNCVDIVTLSKNTDIVLSGKYFLCRTLLPPDKMTSIMTVLDDPTGDLAIRIELYNYTFSTSDTNDSLSSDFPVGQVIVVKNPWFKSSQDGGFVLRCDNPTDVKLISDKTLNTSFPWVKFNGSIPSEFKKYIKREPQSALDWKNEGNRHFVSKKLRMAIEAYTEGLTSTNDDDDVTKALLCNRAAALTDLRCFQNALEDLDQLLCIDPTHLKGIFRKAKALCGLQRFDEAITFLQIHLAESSDNHAFKELLQSAKLQHHQQSTGEYDIVHLHTAEPRKIHEDVAEFAGSVSVTEVAEKGRGLVATQDIVPGQLLILSKAFAIIFPEMSNIGINVDLETKLINTVEQEMLVGAVAERLHFDTSLRVELYKLYAGPDLHPLGNEDNVIDMKRIQGICTYNSFAGQVSKEEEQDEMIESITDKKTSSGLWILPSFINHSCWDANCRWNIYGDLLLVRAFKHINQGEEILITYTLSFTDDRENVMKKHGFKCTCSLCTFESQKSENMTLRQTILEKLSKYTQLMTEYEVKEVTTYLQKLDNLNIPQLNPSLSSTLTGLNRFYCDPERGNYKKCIKYLLRCHLLTQNSPLIEIAVQNAFNLVASYIFDGNVKAGKQWIQILKQNLMECYGTQEMAYVLAHHTLALIKDFGLTF